MKFTNGISYFITTISLMAIIISFILKLYVILS